MSFNLLFVIMFFSYHNSILFTAVVKTPYYGSRLVESALAIFPATAAFWYLPLPLFFLKKKLKASFMIIFFFFFKKIQGSIDLTWFDFVEWTYICAGAISIFFIGIWVWGRWGSRLCCCLSSLSESHQIFRVSRLGNGGGRKLHLTFQFIPKEGVVG